MSTQPKIIPPPWRVVEKAHDDGKLIIVGSGNETVPADLTVALIVGGGPEDYERDTAELIASAPTIRALLEQMLNVAENADETGYVTDVGFIDLDKLHEEVRAALKS